MLQFWLRSVKLRPHLNEILKLPPQKKKKNPHLNKHVNSQDPSCLLHMGVTLLDTKNKKIKNFTDMSFLRFSSLT